MYKGGYQIIELKTLFDTGESVPLESEDIKKLKSFREISLGNKQPKPVLLIYDDSANSGCIVTEFARVLKTSNSTEETTYITLTLYPTIETHLSITISRETATYTYVS